MSIQDFSQLLRQVFNVEYEYLDTIINIVYS